MVEREELAGVQGLETIEWWVNISVLMFQLENNSERCRNIISKNRLKFKTVVWSF